MPIPSNITGQAMIGFSDPRTFFFGFSPSFLYNVQGLGWSMEEAPGFNTLDQKTAGGREIMNPLYLNPLREWKLKFNFLENDPAKSLNQAGTDFEVLYSFYNSMTGKLGEFLYKPRESVVTDQALSVPDSNGYVEIVHSTGPFFAESVQDTNNVEPTIFAHIGGSIGTVDITSTCTFFTPASVGSYTGIVFTSTYLNNPSLYAGQPITANYGLFYRCHFAEDKLSFEEFMYKLQKTGIGLSQVRV